MRFQLFLPVLLMVLCGCEKIFEIDQFTVNIEKPGIIDYWVDGYCPGPNVSASENCQVVTTAGCCDERGRVVYCERDRLYCLPCRDFCSWDSNERIYNCTEAYFGADPGGNSYYCRPPAPPPGKIDYWQDGLCPGLDRLASSHCGNIPEHGCCDDSGQLLFCDSNLLFCLNCGRGFCSWSSRDGFYNCAEDYFGADPDGRSMSCSSL